MNKAESGFSISSEASPSELMNPRNLVNVAAVRYKHRMETAKEIPQSFGDLLRQRRESAGLSQTALAKRAKVDRATIRNIEAGHTDPAAGTLRRLRQVAELGLPAEEQGSGGPQWEQDHWIGALYDPMRLASDCTAMLNGPGGTLEQTYAYIDGQGAADWYSYSNADAYVTSFRDRFPYATIATAVKKRLRSDALDLVALGAGDGKTETRLAQALCAVLSAPDLSLYMLDISHPLLVTAYKHAVATLRAPRVPVIPIHGNFNEIPRLWQLHTQPPGAERRRLWMLLGTTFGNLTHEPTLLGDLHACCRPGDLLLLDYQHARAPAADLAAVRAADQALLKPLPELPQRWLTGLLRRHCRGAREVSIRVEVTNRCAIAGSYELHFNATVKLGAGDTRRFLVFRARRYDPGELQAACREMGWRPVLAENFGQPPTQGALLLERS